MMRTTCCCGSISGPAPFPGASLECQPLGFLDQLPLRRLQRLELARFSNCHRQVMQFEMGQFAALSPAQRQLIQKLSDCHSKFASGKYAGREIEPQQHVVLIMNEWIAELCKNRKI